MFKDANQISAYVPQHPPHKNAQQMSAANKKHYEPLTWDNFFDELSYLDDVNIPYIPGHIHIQSWP